MTFSPAKTRLDYINDFFADCWTNCAIKVGFAHKRSKLILGRQPATTIFLFFGACFMASIMRFSVGPLTAQVL